MGANGRWSNQISGRPFRSPAPRTATDQQAFSGTPGPLTGRPQDFRAGLAMAGWNGRHRGTIPLRNWQPWPCRQRSHGGDMHAIPAADDKFSNAGGLTFNHEITPRPPSALDGVVIRQSPRLPLFAPRKLSPVSRLPRRERRHWSSPVCRMREKCDNHLTLSN